MASFSDNFTGSTNGTTLQAHNVNWNKTATSAIDLTISNNALLYVGGNLAIYTYDALTPPTAEYEITANLQTDNDGHASGAIGVRIDSVNERGYFVKWSGPTNGWQLTKRTGFYASSAIANYVGDNPGVTDVGGQARDVKLTVEDVGADVNLKVYIDGVKRIDYTDVAPGADFKIVGKGGLESDYAFGSANGRFNSVLINDTVTVIPEVTLIDTTVLDGSTGNQATITGFLGSVVAELTDGVNSTQVLNLTNNAGTISYDLPDISAISVNTAGCPWTSAGVQIYLKVIDASDSNINAQASINYNPKATHAVQVAAGVTQVAGSLASHFSSPPLDGSKMLYPITNTTSVSPTFLVTSSIVADQKLIFWDVEDGIHKPINLEVVPTETNAPSIQDPTTATISSTALTPRITTDEGNGTIYAVLVPENDIPNANQIRSGTQSNDTLGVRAGTVNVTSPGVIDLTQFASLTPNTTYNLAYVHVDLNGNVSNTEIVAVTTVAAVNNPPTANAGADQVRVSGDTINLNGIAADSDGTIVSTVWTQIAGTQVVINNANALNANTIAPTVTQATVLTFRLTVTDDDGATAQDTVDIAVSPAVTPTGPILLAGATVGGSASIDLTGTSVVLVSGTFEYGTRLEVYLSVSGTRKTLLKTFESSGMLEIPAKTGHTLSIEVKGDTPEASSIDVSVL